MIKVQQNKTPYERTLFDQLSPEQLDAKIYPYIGLCQWCHKNREVTHVLEKYHVFTHGFDRYYLICSGCRHTLSFHPGFYRRLERPLFKVAPRRRNRTRPERMSKERRYAGISPIAQEEYCYEQKHKRFHLRNNGWSCIICLRNQGYIATPELTYSPEEEYDEESAAVWI